MSYNNPTFAERLLDKVVPYVLLAVLPLCVVLLIGAMLGLAASLPDYSNRDYTVTVGDTTLPVDHCKVEEGALTFTIGDTKYTTPMEGICAGTKRD